MFLVLIQSLFLFLPGYIANIMPVVFARMNWLPAFAFPLDAGRKFRGKEILGKHKTYRGFIAGIVGGIITSLLQFFIYEFLPQAHGLFLFRFDFFIVLEWGFLLGFGALAGDAFKSLLKRRMGIPSGAPFIPFDQLDFVFGGIGMGCLLFVPSFTHFFTLLLITPFLHFLTNLIGYKLDWKKVWW